MRQPRRRQNPRSRSRVTPAQSSAVQRIIDALNDDRWEYRTVKGIARQTGLPEQAVISIVNSDSRIRKSMIPARENMQLYTLKARKNLIGDAWSAFRTVSRAKYSHSGDVDE